MSFTIPRAKNIKVRVEKSRLLQDREPELVSRTSRSSSPQAASSNSTKSMLLGSSAKIKNMAVDFDRQPLWLRKDFAIEEDSTVATESSHLQDETAEECQPLLTGNHDLVEINQSGLPKLDRKRHAKFLRAALGRLPSHFVMLDASRPWMFYWCAMGLHLIREDVEELLQRSLEITLRPIHNVTGGFGGGNGQSSHTATTYASVLALITAGGSAACEFIDRRAMWEWLGRLKQPTGEFQVAEGGENDVRGSFCAMVLASLLNLPNDLPPDSSARAGGHTTLTSGLAEFISKCQTYEGGLGAVPNSEAHGAYTFCGIACLCILGDPAEMLNKYLDMPSLLSWLAQRQHVPEGGLAGRSNKLVDGCYSHWIGGCWALVEAASRDAKTTSRLFNREGLARYILCCCQGEKGGLRDKPSKPPDAYHTLYVLAGLSSAQHYYHYEPSSDTIAPMKAAFGFSRVEDAPAAPDGNVFDANDQVPPMHPVYVIPWGAAEEVRSYFEARPLKV